MDPLSFAVADPNNTAAPDQSAGGKTKIVKTDMSGPSGQPTGSSYDESLPSMKAEMPTEGPGIPAAQPVEVLTFGDPNHTAVDADENDMPGAEGDMRYGFK